MKYILKFVNLSLTTRCSLHSASNTYRYPYLDKLKAEKSFRIGIEMENRFLDFNPNLSVAMNPQSLPPQAYQMSQPTTNCIYQNYHHPLPSIQPTSQFPFQFNADHIGSASNSNVLAIKYKSPDLNGL